MDAPSQTTPQAHDRFLATRQFSSLDGIRCLSILAVIWHHTNGGFSVLRLDSRGFLGVDLFFVLSGFLIVTLLLRERDRNQQIALSHFYTRRTLRIFPLYYGIILCLCIALPVLTPDGRTATGLWHDLPFLLSYTLNWVEPRSLLAIAWSLAAEEQFYLFWPPIERFARRFAVPVLLILIALGQAIALHWLDGPLETWFGFGPREPSMLRETTFTPILLGVLLAHVLHSRTGFQLTYRVLGARVAPIVCLIGIVAMCQFLPEKLGGWPRLGIHLTMVVFVAACVVRDDHAMKPLLSSLPLRRIGAVSYGMYLLHLFVKHVVVAALAGLSLTIPGLEFALCMAGSYAVSELSFRYYESYFLRLKARFA